ncbi:L-lactate dehydrogenase [Propionimicrobium sp. PCR01-08-3]|uniref:L-lactate dehydrogenase n=1 Tax=Propionimicrobium sp. PCR01-08-3 TaxID=3052086 RepID=UPI00255D11BC|nr:L-lactate dehydrogenase [Propionimicrobium sp. PCR01-08-3]WIY82682.1 L-lactate dehydrogenase [Propionimicrobium sp. PCR01-08-3]
MTAQTPTNSPESLYPTQGDNRPTKVAIIGAGAVGSTLAYACVIRGVAREVVLQDINKEKVEAEAMDIAHGIQFTPAASVAGSDDVEICRDADVVVITAGARQKPGQSRLELAGATVSIMEKILPGLTSVAPNAIYIMVANPVDVVTYASLKMTGLPANQMFGSGTVLDSSRLRYLVSLHTGTAVQNIHAYIAGEHGDSEVPLWASAEIGNVPLSRWGKTVSGGEFDADLRAKIGHEVMESAYHIIEGKGSTNYAVGLAVSRIIAAVLNDEQRVLTVSTLLNEWAGITDVCMSTPTIVGRNGVGRRLLPYLSMDERDALTSSAIRLRDVARSLGY